MLRIVMFLLAIAAALCQLPYDYYHDLHLPHDPPLHPVLERAPPTDFTCHGRPRGYYADVHTGCQAYHFCWRQHLVSTDLCANGTLFNEQFQEKILRAYTLSMCKNSNFKPVNTINQLYNKHVCDHFYNVRCGSPYEDL